MPLSKESEGKHTDLGSECCSPTCCKRRTKLLQSFSLKENDWDQKGYLSFIHICLQLGNNMKWKKDKHWNYIHEVQRVGEWSRDSPFLVEPRLITKLPMKTLITSAQTAFFFPVILIVLDKCFTVANTYNKAEWKNQIIRYA